MEVGSLTSRPKPADPFWQAKPSKKKCLIFKKNSARQYGISLGTKLQPVVVNCCSLFVSLQTKLEPAWSLLACKQTKLQPACGILAF